MRLLADVFLLIGAAFACLGALGLVRMPDVYTRIQAGTKAVTLGALAFLIGAALLFPQWWAKLLCILGFILFTSPVSSSTIARAIHLSGIKPWRAQTPEAPGETPMSPQGAESAEGR